MTSIAAIAERLAQARDLPELLDAAYEAFEVLLSAIENHEDSSDPRFVSFVMAATCAANGRDAVLFAPSLPPRQLPWAPAGSGTIHPESAESGADAVVAVSTLLTARLAQAAGQAADPGDRAGCQDAARYARQIQAMLTGSGP